MKKLVQHRTTAWWSAEFFSAKDFLRHGVLVLIGFVIVHLFGLRAYTSVLNGTTGDVGMNPENAALLGALYVLAYLGAVLFAPILFLSAALLSVWEKVKTRRNQIT